MTNRGGRHQIKLFLLSCRIRFRALDISYLQRKGLRDGSNSTDLVRRRIWGDKGLRLLRKTVTRHRYG
jgi:hypothetical protein